MSIGYENYFICNFYLSLNENISLTIIYYAHTTTEYGDYKNEISNNIAKRIL